MARRVWVAGLPRLDRGGRESCRHAHSASVRLLGYCVLLHLVYHMQVPPRFPENEEKRFPEPAQGQRKNGQKVGTRSPHLYSNRLLPNCKTRSRGKGSWIFKMNHQKVGRAKLTYNPQHAARLCRFWRPFNALSDSISRAFPSRK